MFLVKLILKILVLPLLAVLTLVKWIGIFLTSFSAFIFHLIANLFFLVAVCSFAMGLCPGTEALSMLTIGFFFFVTPFVAEWLLTGIAIAGSAMSDFIRS